MTAQPYTVRSTINNRRRKFYRLEDGVWNIVNFTMIEEGDRFMFSDPDSDVRSGIFIARGNAYYSHPYKTHMVAALPHNEAPNKETITFQEIRQSVKNSGITPVFIEDLSGNLVALKSSGMSISGALILKVA
jgi:hypothetical protein